MSQHWDRDPKTGDYVMQGGAPKQTESLTIPAYIRTKAKRGKWLYAPDAAWGSDFYTIQKNRSTIDSGLFESIGARALSPLIEDGRADSITVETIGRARQGVSLSTKITDANGKQQEITLTPIGD